MVFCSSRCFQLAITAKTLVVRLFEFQGPELLTKAGGLHHFMNWERAILTDSGGFQMVSLLKLSEITEEGVRFESPYQVADDSTVQTLRRHRKSDTTTNAATPDDMMLLTPEKSMQIQNAIGADIMMQLDDVVSSTTTGPRVAEAMRRSIRWLHRCQQAHARPTEQFLFPITQGGLELELRRECIDEMTKTKSAGFAIGGLSGGEDKRTFWQIVTNATAQLTNQRPRYVMGVGYAEDLVVCVALGADMFDCVFPTRTARFGCALVDSGQLNLKNKLYELDFNKIDEGCECVTCSKYTRSYLHHIATDLSVAARLISVHNIAYQMGLMRRIRDAVQQNRFPEFVRQFMATRYGETGTPEWIVEALLSVGIELSVGALSMSESVGLGASAETLHGKSKTKPVETEKEDASLPLKKRRLSDSVVE